MSLYSEKTTVYVFNVAIALMPISLLFSPALNSIFIGLLMLWSFISKKSFSFTLRREHRLLLMAYVSFLSLHVISLCYTFNYARAFGLLKIRLPLLLIPLIFYLNYKLLRKKIILNVYLYGVVISSLFTLINAFYSLYINGEFLDVFLNYYVRYFYVSFMPYEMHPSYYGLFLCSAFAISLNFITNRINIGLHLFFCLIYTISIYLISSQMMLFIFFFILILYLIKWFNKAYGKCYLGLGIFVIFSILILVTNYTINHYEEVLSEYKTKSKGNLTYRVFHFFSQGDITRKKNWESALYVIKDNFIFGVGLGDGVDEMQKFREENTWIYSSRLNAHNQYLEEFVNFGVLGLICFLFFLFSLFFFLKNTTIYLSFWVIISCSMITESILNRQVGVTLFSFLLFLSFFLKVDEFENA